MSEEYKAEEKKEEKAKAKAEIISWIKTISFALVLAFLINNFIITSYNALIRRFEVDVAMIEDEKATVLRMLDTLPAEKFRYFAEITFEPYINLETDTTIIYEG